MKLYHKILKFTKSLWWHIWAGFPKSTNEEIMNRYKICLSCEEFDNKNSQCMICGCNLGTKRIFMNKLAWADQECPISKWPKISR